VRIAESLAKMRLATFATEADVDEALRLFQVSTLDAAMTGSLAGLVMEFCIRTVSFCVTHHLLQEPSVMCYIVRHSGVS